ncbi:MAG: serine/threonine protein kinase, partial [Deltaproteobacteria bacterium]|nr:serine/threonine protein kinase [Deltaproteobacteria bacterium]
MPWTPGPLPYEMGGVIGRGGMGEVRAAHDPLLSRDLAVKLVTPGDPASARRLAREAALTARLEHPGIVPVYAAGRADDGRSWYAMRLLPGRSLAEAVAEAGDDATRLRLVRHVLDAALAVAYAHGQGVLHRDLKPANILTGAFGETIVADWGLACTLEEARVGEGGLGTPGYASPEQLAGEPIDPRADVHGLGAILVEVLTGAPVDLGVRGALRGASRLAPELVAVAERAMAPRAADRYPSARAFADDLLAWFEGRRVGAHEYTTGELLSRLVGRWWVPLVVAAVGLVGVSAALAFGSREATAARELADASSSRAVAAREEERRAFAAALRAQSEIAVAGGRLMEAEILATHSVHRHDTAAARGGLAAVYGRPRWSLAATREGWRCDRRALSADGQRVLCIRDDAAHVFDVEGGASW